MRVLSFGCTLSTTIVPGRKVLVARADGVLEAAVLASFHLEAWELWLKGYRLAWLLVDPSPMVYSPSDCYSLSFGRFVHSCVSVMFAELPK